MLIIFLSGMAVGYFVGKYAFMLSGTSITQSIQLCFEVFTGTIFILVYVEYGLGIQFFKWVILLSIMLLNGVVDFLTGQVYLITVLLGLAAAIFFIGADSYLNPGHFATYLTAGFASVMFISFIIIFTKGMGWGDAEIFFICGLFLGIERTILLIFLSFIFGGASAGAMLAVKKASEGMSIPFVPYIAAAAIVNVLAGNEIISWYLGFV